MCEWTARISPVRSSPSRRLLVSSLAPRILSSRSPAGIAEYLDHCAAGGAAGIGLDMTAVSDRGQNPNFWYR